MIVCAGQTCTQAECCVLEGAALQPLVVLAQVAKSPAAPLAAFAYRITDSGLNILEGHHVPDQVQSSIINMQVAHEISYEPQAMDM